MVFHYPVVLKVDDASYVIGQLRVESFFVTRFRDILAPLALLETGQIGTLCDRCFQGNPTSVYGSSDATPTLGVSAQTGHQFLQAGRSFCALIRTGDKDRLVRDTARKKGVDLFINARTDLFFGKGDPAKLMDEALDRANAYAAAGASGFFIPGLTDDALIGRICEATKLPVNVMMMDGMSSAQRLATLGAARVSYGPIPYLQAMEALKKQAQNVL